MEPLSSSVCRSCRMRLTTVPRAKYFSTSSRQQIVPPESPAFVDVPTSYQPDLPPTIRRKGILPVPRELFPAKRPDKPSQKYLDNVTKDPLPHNVRPIEQLTEQGKFRARMAETRKRHLREGLTELYKRKQTTSAQLSHRSHKRKEERTRLLSQPEREDARLTNNSVPVALRQVKSSTPIADDLAVVKAMYEQKKANYERNAAAKKEERLDALHTLYMNAREFITTEEQLNEAIEFQFDPVRFRNDVAVDGKSIWNLGAPETIREMISNTKGGAKTMSDSLARITRFGDRASIARHNRDQERFKKIAEKLSGGKI